MEKNFRIVATLKMAFDRQRGYLGIINTVLLLKIVGFEWWYLALIPIWVAWTIIDWCLIFPAERKIRFKEILESKKNEDPVNH